MKVSTSRLLILLFVVALLGYWGASYLVSDPEPSEVNIGYSPLIINLPFIVALENGYLDGLAEKVKIEKMPSTNSMRDAVVNGRVDFANALGTEMFLQNNNLQEGLLRAIYFNVLTAKRYVDAFVVKKNSTINSISDLDGGRVGGYPSSTVTAFLNLIGKNQRVKYDIVSIAPAEAFQTIEIGGVDAMFMIEPQITQAINTGKYKVMEEAPIAKYISSPIPIGAYVVNGRFADLYPQKVKLYQQALHKAVKDIEQDPKSAVTLAEKFLGITAGGLSGVNLPKWESGCVVRSGEGITNLATYLVTEQILSNPNSHNDSILCLTDD